MTKYEFMIIVNPTISEEERATKIDALKSVLDKAGAKIINEDVWGDKKLAYKINKQDRAWGALAERCEQFLVKWKLVYAEGRLKTRVIEKDNWEKIYKTEVVVWNIIFLNKRGDFDDKSQDEDMGGSDFDDDKF